MERRPKSPHILTSGSTAKFVLVHFVLKILKMLSWCMWLCRLFLTMDPVHGELSRAMRNRGVEVYISGEHEGVCWDTLDLKTLLHTAGVTGDCVCDLLIEIHKSIKSAIWGKRWIKTMNEYAVSQPASLQSWLTNGLYLSDSPASSVASLLHAVTLLSCQLQRGVDLPSALQHACGEAYSLCQRTAASQKVSTPPYCINPGRKFFYI